MIHPNIQIYLPQVIELLEKHKVKSALMFGSVLSEKFNEESDVDFLVNLQEGLDPVDAGGHLWKIDLLTERSLKNPYFINEINQTKFPIYE